MKFDFLAATLSLLLCLPISGQQKPVVATPAMGADGAPNAVHEKAASEPVAEPELGISPAGLLCENTANPLGVDVTAPRFSWHLTAESGRHDKSQSAYQIVVASSERRVGDDSPDLWDSGKVSSSESLAIPYAGKPLVPSQQAFWKVRVWDEAGRVSAWSPPAHWTMGLLNPTDWQGAKWIGGPDHNSHGGKKTIGYHGSEAKSPDKLQWVQVDLGKPNGFDSIRLVPMVHDGRNGFGFPIRFKVEVSDDASFAHPTMIADHTGADFPNPGASPVVIPAKAGGRYVRVTATRLWQRDANTYVFALHEMAVFAQGNNLAAGTPVTALESTEAFGWGASGLTNQSDNPDKVSASPGLRMRREFAVKPGLRRAILHICGLGQYELTVNGKTIGDDWLTPGWTLYNKTCLYDTVDLTHYLQPGSANVMGVDLVGGMYRVTGDRYTKFKGSFGPLQMIAVLRLEYDDHSQEILTTDNRWKQTPGPYRFACIYGGLDFDARLDALGWSTAGFHDTAWNPAVVWNGPGGTLRGQTSAAPPLRKIETLNAVRTNPIRPSVMVYDFGQNAPIAPSLTVSGPAGAKIRLIPSELLHKDGRVDRGSCAHGAGGAWWEYICKGGGQEHWSPRFWYHGSRYLQVELSPAAGSATLPQIHGLTAVVVHSSSPPVGEFTCSNAHFNRVRTLIRWAQRANLVSVLTDCPHRERLGWLEQYHLHGPSLRYEWDMAKLYAKTMRDMEDSQTADGLVPDIAPEYVKFGGGFRDSPEWGASAVLVPWQQYEWTGDLSLVRRHYTTMKRYVDYLSSKAKGGLLSYGLGDWYDIGPKSPGTAQLTPIPLTATAYYFMCADTLAKCAKLTGNQSDAEGYSTLAQRISASFNTAFFHADPGSYATGSQTANALPLVAGLVPQSRRQDVLRALVRDIEGRNYAVTAGDIGHRYVLRALADAGRSDVIARMHSQTDRPGYGYIISQGATSLTEAWDAGRASSQNHFMLGHITEWFYHDLAGIRPDPASPGFKHFSIAPQPVANVDSASARYISSRGPIRSAWQNAGGNFTLKVEIPPNTTATVILPDGSSREAGSGVRQWTIPLARLAR